MKMVSGNRFADMMTLLQRRRIVLMTMGYLFLTLQFMGVVDAKSLNGAQTQTNPNDFPLPLPKDGQELSLFPETPCNCEQQNSDEDTTQGSVFSEEFPQFELISQENEPSSQSVEDEQNEGNEFQNKNDVELIMPRRRENLEKLQKLQAPEEQKKTSKSEKAEIEAEDPNVIKQVIFITPPEYVYKHDIKVEPKQRPRTVIYVFPPMVKHIYNITDKRDHSRREEPKVFYLGGKQHFDNEMDNNRESGENGLETVPEFATGPAYLPPPHIKRNSEITQESRQSYATTTKLEQDPDKMISSSPHKISQRAFSNPNLNNAPFRQFESIVPIPIPEPPQKHYRRFDYFSKTDYENLKSAGQLSPNSVQYRTGPLMIPPPSPTIRSNTFSPNPTTFTFSVPSPNPSFLQQPTTYRPNIQSVTESSFPRKNSQGPVVRLEYERVQHFPQTGQQEYATTQNDGSLSPPPQSGNDYLPKKSWEWGSDMSSDKQNQFTPFPKIELTNQQSQAFNFGRNNFKDNDGSSSNQGKSAKVIFPQEDMDIQASENSDYQIIPAFFRNYFYQGPNTEIAQ